jgi:hypothetical protein
MRYTGIITLLREHHGFTQLHQEIDPYFGADVKEVKPIFAVLGAGMVMALCFFLIECAAQYKRRSNLKNDNFGYQTRVQ